MENIQNTIPNANKSGQEKRNVPTLRFPEFTDEWKNSSFADTFDMLSNNTLSRAELNYESGIYKNIHYGDILVKYNAYIDVTDETVPYINEAVVVSCKLNHLLNGDIIFADTAEDYTVGKATEIESADKIKTFSGLHTIPCRPKFAFAQRYLGYFVNSPAYHNQLLPFIQGIKVSSVSKSQIVKTEIRYPSLQEQAKISCILTLIDKRIELQNKIIEDLKLLKKEICNRFFKKIQNDSSFSYIILEDILFERKEYCEKNGTYIHGTLSKDGVAPKSERYDRDFLVRTEDKKYKVTHFNDICYNPANLKFGVICRNTFGGNTYPKNIAAYLYSRKRCKSHRIDCRCAEISKLNTRYSYDERLV